MVGVAYSQAKDTLYFYHETKIVGELLAIRLGRVEIDADGNGIIKIKNSKIESINDDVTQLYSRWKRGARIFD